MKRTSIYLLAFCFIPLIASSQSTVEYQTDAAIEVQTGADVSADNIITNSNYSGGGTFNGGPLPVEMAEMTVQAAKNTATISWSTASETENFGFDVERRRMDDGVVAWAQIGFVPGSGTSSSPRDYSFVDQRVSPGRYAYRIKQIDHSGAFTYTSTLEVEIGLAPKEFTLSQNYPNPFNPTTTIEFTLPEDGHVTLKVFDMAGREIASLFNGDMKAGVYHQVVFDATRLASGMYVSQLEAGGKVTTRRMMLVK
jgi:hypothetical protein